MQKYLCLIDGTKIPIDDVSEHGRAICYPENMQQVDEWWSKLTPDTINHQVYIDNETEFDVINDATLHFNKIELEHCSTGLLMRIVFASSLEEEMLRLTRENEALKEDSRAYHILTEGSEHNE